MVAFIACRPQSDDAVGVDQPDVPASIPPNPSAPSEQQAPATCDEADGTPSYFGCEFWPTVTPNSGVPTESFSFTVMVANPHPHPVSVEVSHGPQKVGRYVLEPDGVRTIELPWILGLLGEAYEQQSLLAKRAAYRLRASSPVAAYQFSPFEFAGSPHPSCTFTTRELGCIAATNDASLLLPVNLLDLEHYVLSYPTLRAGSDITALQDLPGFVAVVGTQANTHVDVRAAGAVRAGNGIAAFAPNQERGFNLDPGDVLLLNSARVPNTPSSSNDCDYIPDLQLYQCPTPKEYDLTGTRVFADKPVSVISGHDCTFVPANTAACDHIEDTMPALRTWGSSTFVTAPHPPPAAEQEQPAPYFLRILSGSPDNSVAFDPPVFETQLLSNGQWVELGPTRADLQVTATGKVLVGQYMVGQGEAAPASANHTAGGGDPSLAVAIPTAQYRTSYAFIAPHTYSERYVNVIAPIGARIELDGEPLDAPLHAVADGYGVARIGVTGGAHKIRSAAPFGLTVYGYGAYTSFMYGGGLNLSTVDLPR